MIIYILLLLSGGPNLNIFVNSFDSKQKCEARIKVMSKSYNMTCIKTVLNK